MANIVRSIGIEHLRPIAPPPQEALPSWRRIAEGLRHSKSRDAEAIHHHYDVSNTFYEWVLGPSMAYTCACYPLPTRRWKKRRTTSIGWCSKNSDSEEGDRLLDVGCGWGGMVRHAARHGVQAGRCDAVGRAGRLGAAGDRREGLCEFAEVRHGDYRDVADSDFDAVSSIGLTEHIGVANYPAYFDFLQSKMRPGALLLNHSITRPDNSAQPAAGGFIDRYVFPDGELTGSGRIITEAQNAGLEVVHEENLRHHYAMTLRDWCRNLVEHWDEAVEEVGLPTAKVWGLYMAGSRLGFETNVVQLHQVSRSRPTTAARTAVCRCGRGGPESLNRRSVAPRVRSAAVRAPPLRDRDADRRPRASVAASAIMLSSSAPAALPHDAPSTWVDADRTGAPRARHRIAPASPHRAHP